MGLKSRWGHKKYKWKRKIKLFQEKMTRKLYVASYKTYWRINLFLPESMLPERKNPIGMKRIDFDEILEILNGLYRDDDKKTQISTTVTDEENEDMFRIHAILERAGLARHIRTTRRSRIERGTDDYDIGHKIIIEDLLIIVRDDQDIKPHPYFSREITFQNNVFLCPSPKKNRQVTNSTITYKGMIHKKLLLPFGIKFENNIFRNISITLEAKSSMQTLIKLTRNIFKGHSEIKIENVETVSFKSDSCTTTWQNQASLIFRDNEIPKISLNINSPIYFRGSNKIGEIKLVNKKRNETDGKQGIYWGPYQKVNYKSKSIRRYKKSQWDYYAVYAEEKILAESHKELFTALKAIAAEKNDKSQESILNREILKCDHDMLKSEFWKDAWQDKIIMIFGWVTSNHGISLARPFFLLLGSNTFFAFSSILVACLYERFDIGLSQWFWKWLYIWAGMLNPVSSLALTTGIEDNIAILIFNALQKGIFAILIYEMIRVGRRFIAK